MFSLLKIPTFRAIFLIRNQYVEPNSSAHLCRFLKKCVKFSCFISFPLMFILTLSVLHFLPFGKNIMKFLFYFILRKFVGVEPSCMFCNSSFISSIRVSTSV